MFDLLSKTKVPIAVTRIMHITIKASENYCIDILKCFICILVFEMFLHHHLNFGRIIYQFFFFISELPVYLCVLDLGIYVDSNGMRSRKLELMWPAPPLAVCKFFFLSLNVFYAVL